MCFKGVDMKNNQRTGQAAPAAFIAILIQSIAALLTCLQSSLPRTAYVVQQ